MPCQHSTFDLNSMAIASLLCFSTRFSLMGKLNQMATLPLIFLCVFR